MSDIVLYSTNVFLKQHIQAQYQGDVHYVWCSECFDSTTLSTYSPGALVPPSSNPADIYKELQRDVQRKDSHSSKITAQKASLIRLASDWHASSKINVNDKDDIIYMVNNASFDDWRPLIYIIPRDTVASRLQIVPMAKRAGFGNEYIIQDLERNEFDIIEL